MYLALLKPGDTILGMSLAHGGHLTHGAKVNFSGKLYNAVQYGLDTETGLIDYDEVERLAVEHQPKMIVAGFSAYSQDPGLRRVSARSPTRSAPTCSSTWPTSPVWSRPACTRTRCRIADVVTTTTHKTLRGPRGGLILAKANEEIEKKLNSAVFPGAQGGPLMHVIAAKAVCFKEALEPGFKDYQQQVIDNAQAMASVFIERGYDVVSGGTDNHLFLVSLIASGPDRQRRGRRPGPCPHHRQQERRAERPAVAVRHLGPAHRHPGSDHARLQGDSVRNAGRLDLRHPRQPRRCRCRGQCRPAGCGPVRRLPGLSLSVLE